MCAPFTDDDIAVTTDLTRLANVRDLGGRAVVGGGGTRYGVLMRADQPLPGDLAPELESWPPRTIIDLRSPHEVRGPHPLEGGAERLLRFDILDAADPARLAQQALSTRPPDRSDLADLYLRMLRQAAPSFVEIARASAISDGPVLVHCAAGKDRTGVCAAVLLGAVGVESEEIIADYQATSENTSALIERLVYAEPEPNRAVRRERLLAMVGSLMSTPEPAMRAVLAELSAARDGAGGWLVERGLAPAELDALRERLVER